MYGAQVWTPKLLSVTDKITRLQKNAMRIMTLSEFRAHSGPLFKQQEILKFYDITLFNCVFVFDYLNGNLPESFLETFHRINDSHANRTRQACTGMLSTPRYSSTEYGLKCIYKRCINSRNGLHNKLKETITKHISSKYDE